MDCRRVRDRMAAWMDRELSPGESSQVEVHLSGCTVCADLRDRFAEQESVLALLPPGPNQKISDPSFWDRMDAALSDELDGQLRGSDEDSWRKRRFSVSIGTVMVYAAALFLAVLWGWSHSEEMTSFSEDASIPVVDSDTPAETATMDLADAASSPDVGADELRTEPAQLRPQPRVRVPPELIQPAAYMPHRGNF